jgi:hypothetical protein
VAAILLVELPCQTSNVVAAPVAAAAWLGGRNRVELRWGASRRSGLQELSETALLCVPAALAKKKKKGRSTLTKSLLDPLLANVLSQREDLRINIWVRVPR